MSIKELIEKLQEYPLDSIVELKGSGGTAGSDSMGYWGVDGICDSVRETDNGVILSSF